jgi:two-component system phosphate regulon sensor histidine kinase PhoR
MNVPLPWPVVAAGAFAVAALAVTAWRLRARLGVARGTVRAMREEVMVRETELHRLRAALEGAGEGLIVLEARGRIVAWNSAARTLLGEPAGFGPGRPLTEVLPLGQLVEALAAVGGAAGPAQREFDFTGPVAADGGERALVVRVRALAGLGFAVGIDDQSRIRQLESLRRDFVANVSHELKTPLAAIKGFVETLLDDPAMPDTVRQRFLGRIARQSERLNTLVGDLLTLSRLDEVEAAPGGKCDLVSVIRETLRDLLPIAERGRITLTGHGIDRPIEVVGEGESLRQVVGNLVDNAIKYTAEGGAVTVRVAGAGDHVLLEVVDTGIGLGPEDQKRVFERFYRVDRARSRELGGTGLGLSIVKNTVRSVGGEVGVESALGRGSRFWVRLPRPGLTR